MNLTREQIEQMPAGAEMDYLIATKIFKARKPTPEQVAMIKIVSFQFGHGNPQNHWAETVLIELLAKRNEWTGADYHFIQPQRYSTDITAAWSVVEKMRDDGWLFHLSDVYEIPEWSVHFYAPDCPDADAMSPSAPLAICRAALIATLEQTPVNTD